MKVLANKKEIHPGKKLLFKFILLCILLVGYFSYLSIQYDLATGGVASVITWSFFVLCTLAITVNVVSLLYFSEYYQTTKLTSLFHTILINPYPYWSVILISGTGTFLSIRFADEVMDIAHHRDREFFHRHGIKHKVLIIIFFVLVLFGYYELMTLLGIETNF